MVVAPTPGSAARSEVSRCRDASVRSIAELTCELRSRLEGGAGVAACVAGVEHEYSLWRGDAFLDFRPFAPGLARFGEAWHPTNPLVFRSPDGVQLQADTNVAEAATPPVPLAPGFADELAALSADGRARLRAVVPTDSRLHGESTHLSIACDPATVRDLALRFLQSFAPALMLMLDRADSPGLLVRPRPGRLELCGEYVSGERLAAVLAFATGCVRALEDGSGETLAAGERAPLPYLEVSIEAARGRFGWFVASDAFAVAMYEAPRDAVLRTIEGASVIGQQHLEAAWQVARPFVEDDVSTSVLALVDGMVDGSAPLGVELPAEGECACEGAADAVVRTLATTAASNLPEAGLHRRVRPGYELCVEAATWDFVAFRAHDGERSVIVNAPRARLRGFLHALDTGALDDLVCEAIEWVRLGAVGAPLRLAADTEAGGFFSSIVRSSDLLPRDVMGVGPLELRPFEAAGRVLADLAPSQVDYAGVSAADAEQPAVNTTAPMATSTRPPVTATGANGGAAIAAPPASPPGQQRERRRPKGTVPPPIPATSDPWWRQWLVPGIAGFVALIVLIVGGTLFLGGGGGDEGGSQTGGSGTAVTSDPTQSPGTSGTEAPVQPTDAPVVAPTDQPSSGGGDLVGAFTADPGSFMSTTFQGSFAANGRGLTQTAPAWASDVSPLAVRGPNGQIYIKFGLPAELLGRLCGELDLKDGNSSVGGDIDWCVRGASGPFYFANVETIDVGDATGLVNLVICTGISDASDLILRAWLFVVAEDGSYEAIEFAIRASSVPDAPSGVTFPDAPAGLPFVVVAGP